MCVWGRGGGGGGGVWGGGGGEGGGGGWGGGGGRNPRALIVDIKPLHTIGIYTILYGVVSCLVIVLIYLLFVYTFHVYIKEKKSFILWIM